MFLHALDRSEYFFETRISGPNSFSDIIWIILFSFYIISYVVVIIF
jgi:hypothetical protein